jgi:hypothetical protein
MIFPSSDGNMQDVKVQESLAIAAMRCKEPNTNKEIAFALPTPLLPQLQKLLEEELLRYNMKIVETWQPIETAPKSKAVIIFDPDVGVGEGYYYSLKDEFGEYSTWKMGLAIVRPTHWMLLPEEPRDV